MAKRKNLSTYYPAVAGWDVAIGMDRRGNCPALDDGAALELSSETAARFEAALAEIVGRFATYPSVPTLDTALVLIDEARTVGLLSREAAAERESQVRKTWSEYRDSVWNAGEDEEE